MRTIPIDTNRLRLMIGGLPSAATNQDGSERRDRDGRPLVNVPMIAVVDGTAADTFNLRLPGPVAQIPPLTQVTVKGLVGRPWTIDGRSGFSFQAEALAPADKK